MESKFGRMSAEEFQRKYGSGGATAAPAVPDPPPKRNGKYNNQKTELDGETFDSKKEAAYMRDVKLMLEAGEIMGYGRQVVFQLPGKIKYIADFVLLEPGGGYTVVDVKGHRTDVYKLKKRMMRECLGIEIKEV